MITFLPGEKFKKIRLDKSLRLNYAISNFGRMVSFTDKIREGNLVQGSVTEDYRMMRYKLRGGKKIKHKYVLYYKLVAQNFLKKPGGKRTFLIHIDHNKMNDAVTNLKWVTEAEWSAHNQNSPAMKSMRRKIQRGEKQVQNSKLSRSKVAALKKQIENPRRRDTLKQLADKYGISEMQLYRIKRGENWGYLKSK